MSRNVPVAGGDTDPSQQWRTKFERHNGTSLTVTHASEEAARRVVDDFAKSEEFQSVVLIFPDKPLTTDQI